MKLQKMVYLYTQTLIQVKEKHIMLIFILVIIDIHLQTNVKISNVVYTNL